ncbi:MAG: tRNA (adenosine(37)-N6)-threonylcarbamoyltransferase complex ATPase subunit type 1 TsaE [bacterium]|nr:tRNA (adenosine(37)-N6)-threonylcarbamoyltransferase complex ATPase subunit type 1 TsaE [bacterium]
MTEHNSKGSENTEEIAQEFADNLSPGDLVLLEGDLAAGKTTFTRGLTQGLGGDPAGVSSPTFVLIQSYSCTRHGVSELHHIDLYRIADETEILREIGIEELLSDSTAIVAIEWPREALLEWVPADIIPWRVSIEIVSAEERRILIERG